MIHIRSQVKTRQSQSCKFKKMAKNSILKFCKTLYMRHNFCQSCLIIYIYMMHKYETDPTRTVCATERTRDEGRTDGWRDGGRTEWNQYAPKQLRCAEDIIKFHLNVSLRVSICSGDGLAPKEATWTNVDQDILTTYAITRSQWVHPLCAELTL